MPTIAFDLDGTLITAGPKQSFLLRATALRFGIGLDAAEIWRRKREGMSNGDVLADLGIARDVAQSIMADWGRSVETPYWQSLDQVFDGTHRLLSEVVRAGHRCILVTARRNAYLLRQQLRQLDLTKHFDRIFCVDPARAAAEKAAVLRDCGAGLFVGDAESDYEAARRADIAFRAVTTGQRSARFLAQHGITDPSPTLRAALDAITRSDA